MQQIINFLIKYRNLLLYLSLMSIALVFTIQSHQYHRNSVIHSASNLTGGVLDSRRSVYEYLSLKQENNKLRQENALLRMQQLILKDSLIGTEITQIVSNDNVPYRVFPARVIKNSYDKVDNYITIDIGADQGVEPDMGVITTNGILGVVDVSSDRFSRVISILNSDISLNTNIKGTNTIGSLIWEGHNPYKMSLIDVPRLAQVKPGDTIITGVQSTIFPPNIPIGIIDDVKLVENGSRYKIDVNLFTNMTEIGTAYVIKNRDQTAIQIIDTLTTSVINE